MTDYGFYGGIQGTPFVMKKNFASIQDMIDTFKQGDAYTDVKYGEYVIIDTADKGNDDNGKIYRRGNTYADQTGGAQYICQIKGAGGASPHLLLSTIADINQIKAQGNVSFSGQGEYSYTENNLVPGKDGDTYNDSITWAYCSVTMPEGGEVVSYIGFAFPYTVIDYEVESVPFNYEGALSERLDTKDHPFYEKWKLRVPRGAKGDTIDNVRVIIPTSDNVENYSGKDDDISNQRQIMVYDQTSYEDSLQGGTKTLYLGDYNMIESISMDSEGHITIHYTHAEDQLISVIARWITAVHLSDDGKLSIDYTTGESTEAENTIKWIKSIDLSDEGNLVVTYNDNTTQTIQEGIKWITDVSLTDDGTFKIEFGNNEAPYQTKIKYPTEINLDTGAEEGAGTQKILVQYNDGTSAAIGNPLNYVMQQVMTDDYHILLLFSDPAKRQKIIEDGQNITYGGRNDWYDLGAVKDESGILIGLNLTLDHFTGGTSNIRIINQLNEEYPNGLPSDNVDLKGKIITVGDTDDQKKFFAFDYQQRIWYYVGDASAGGPVTQTQGIIVGYEDDDELIEQAEDLPIGTVWMIVED